jgi:hypothetical protein
VERWRHIPLQVNGSIAVIDGDEIASAPLGSGVSDLKRSLYRMVLRRELVSVDYRTLDPTDLALIDEPKPGGRAFHNSRRQ